MERQGETERATLYRLTGMWLILSMVLTLTVGLWYPAEEATSDTFKPIELVPGDAYNPGIAIVTGMKSTGLVIGQYFPNTGEPGVAEWLGYRGLGAAFRMLPLLEPKTINDTNVIVGNYQAIGDFGQSYEAGFRMDDTSLRIISILDSTLTRVYGVNNAGTIVGETLLKSDGRSHAFIRSANGTLTYLEPPFVSYSGCGARSINNHGDVVGGGAEEGGWAWVGGVFHQLRVPGNTYMLPLTINDKREIGGFFCRVDETCSGFVLRNGVYEQVDVEGYNSTYTEVVGIDPKTGRLAVNAQGNGGENRGWLATPTKSSRQ